MSTPIPVNHAAFTLQEAVLATSARVLRGSEAYCAHVVTDSRQAVQGGLFVALRGERFDAHQFLEQAEAAGAALLLVEDCAETAQFLERSHGHCPVLAVQDTTRALGLLARAHRERWAGHVIAIAGSAGKTTTRAVMQRVFEARLPGRVHATSGNLNNRIGVPMTLLSLSPNHRVGVVEVGTNRPGEVSELSVVCQPDVAVLTLVDLEHTEGLMSLDGVEEEEGGIFDGLRADGVAIGNGDDPRAVSCLRRSGVDRQLTYGVKPGADWVVADRRLVSPSSSEVTLRFRDQHLHVRLPLLGRAGALALGASLCAVTALQREELLARANEAGDSCADLAADFPRWGGALTRALADLDNTGRGRVVALSDGRWVIDDSYNSNPGSVKSSIEGARELAAWSGGRLHLVLGEMLELGTLSEREHRAMGAAAAACGAASLIGVQGDARWAVEQAERTGMKAEFLPEARSAAALLKDWVSPRDVVLVKGSRGVRTEHVVEDLQRSWGRN